MDRKSRGERKMDKKVMIPVSTHWKEASGGVGNILSKIFRTRSWPDCDLCWREAVRVTKINSKPGTGEFPTTYKHDGYIYRCY